MSPETNDVDKMIQEFEKMINEASLTSQKDDEKPTQTLPKGFTPQPKQVEISESEAEYLDKVNYSIEHPKGVLPKEESPYSPNDKTREQELEEYEQDYLMRLAEENRIKETRKKLQENSTKTDGIMPKGWSKPEGKQLPQGTMPKGWKP